MCFQASDSRGKQATGSKAQGRHGIRAWRGFLDLLQPSCLLGIYCRSIRRWKCGLSPGVQQSVHVMSSRAMSCHVMSFHFQPYPTHFLLYSLCVAMMGWNLPLPARTASPFHYPVFSHEQATHSCWNYETGMTCIAMPEKVPVTTA